MGPKCHLVRGRQRKIRLQKRRRWLTMEAEIGVMYFGDEAIS